MRKPPRIVILLAALAGLGLWIALDTPPDKGAPAKAPAVATQAAAPGPAPAPAHAPPQLPPRAALNAITADPFAAAAPPPAPAPTQETAAVAAAPPPPAAPPMPYRFAGRVHKDGKVEVFLAKGDEVFAVQRGQTVDGEYRVEKLGRSEMALVHVPSGTREIIEYGPPITDDIRALAGREGAPPRNAAPPAKAGATAGPAPESHAPRRDTSPPHDQAAEAPGSPPG